MRLVRIIFRDFSCVDNYCVINCTSKCSSIGLYLVSCKVVSVENNTFWVDFIHIRFSSD